MAAIRVTVGLCAILLVGIVAYLAGCAPEPPPPLRLGVNLWPGYEPLYLARELGHYDDSGIRLVEYSSDSQAMRAYNNGALDGAALTLDEAISLAADGHGPKIVAVLDISHGADVVVARPGITSLEEIRGKRVGVESTGLGAYFLSLVLEVAGLSREDIHIVPVELGAHLEAFREGRVDVLVTAEPRSSILIGEGASKLFDSSQIPGQIVDVLVIRDSYVEAHPEAVETLIQGWAAAIAYFKEAPREAAAMMAPREGISTEQFLEAMKGLRLPDLEEDLVLMQGESPPLAEAIQRVSAAMREAGLIHEDVPAETLLAPRFLQSVRIEQS